jgi:hypothetical protein
MGMFDTIYCEALLPIPKTSVKKFTKTKWEEIDFQSKSLDCFMGSFVIRKTGALFQKITKGNWVDDKDAFLKRRFEVTSKVYTKFKYTGILNFYSSILDDEGNSWEAEFNAKFDEGKLINIKKVAFKLCSTKEEIEARDKQIEIYLKSLANSPEAKFRAFMHKASFGYWSKFWRSVRNAIQNTSNKICNLILKYLL